jgi:hypothetical protein
MIGTFQTNTGDTMSEEVAVVEEASEKAPKTATRVTGISKEAALKVLATNNPKRAGSSAYDRFEGYFKDGIETVNDALDAGLTMGDIKYDIAHGFIEVDGAVVEEYIPSTRGPRGSSGEVDAPEELMEEGESAETEEENLFG